MSGARLEIFFKILLVSFSVLLLLTPVGILYLVDMTKSQSAGVVVCFVFVFSVAISLVPGTKYDKILVGLSAYMAVLVTFLAQVSGSAY